MSPAFPYNDAQTVNYAIMAAVLPFAAFVVNFLFLAKNRFAGWVSTVAILGSAVLAATVFVRVWNDHAIHMQTTWFVIGTNKVQVGILLNNLSVILLGLVPAIALPVHVYSTAYMKHEPKYFRYLSFFCFSMLALVVVNNLVLFYAFWELVGFSSYLLIGFWYDRDTAVQANKKAFIINRIGDIGLLTAIMILFAVYHTFDIDTLFGANGYLLGTHGPDIVVNAPPHSVWLSPETSGNVVVNSAYALPVVWQWVAFTGVFLAVAAKSAQFPLHTWLPDAMEGPTSVSALIHAATMVASGVFLLARVYPMFSETQLTVLAVVGCFTAFMAATIALTQNDLKRILAYSTISQLGYMVMAMGVGAYSSSLFHLATHAFFKCLLFLVAGIIIHEVKHIKDDNNLDIDPQNILHMGGLRKKLPLTFVVAVIAAIALIGLPLTSGYLSKDGILIQAFDWSDAHSSAYKIIPIMALVTSWLTAFYVTRMIVKVFFGEFRLQKMNPDIHINISDGGWQYKVPLVLLAICCLFPVFSWHPLLYEDAWLYHGLQPSTSLARESLYHVIVPALVNILSVVVMYSAYAVYSSRNSWSFPQNGLLYRISSHEWYIDRFYNRVIVSAVVGLGNAAFWFDRTVIDGIVDLIQTIGLKLSKLSAWFDKYIVDGILWLVTKIVQAIGDFARRFQGGKVQYYLFSMLAAVIAAFILKLIWN